MSLIGNNARGSGSGSNLASDFDRSSAALSLGGFSIYMKNRMNAHSGRQEDYERSNREMAQIILNDPTQHGGEESLGVRWARLVLTRAAAPAREHHRRGQSDLFSSQVAKIS